MFQIGLFAPYLLDKWVDCNQTCKDYHWDTEKNKLFVKVDPCSKVIKY